MSQILLCQGSAQRLPLADQSVHCCVTSPPYLGLRNYEGLAPEPWRGGRYAPVPGAPMIEVPGPQTWEELEACPHAWGSLLPARKPGQVEQTKWKNAVAAGAGQTTPMGRFCQKCIAWLGCLGNEPTPAFFVWHTLLWLRECRRVLRDDGCLWLNIGDSFSSGNRQGYGTREGYKQQTNRGMNGTCDPARLPQPDGYSQGSLLAMPQQIMLAAVADGWTCRNDLVWQKVSPMPESVRGWRYEQPPCACVGHRSDTDREVQGKTRLGSDVGAQPWRPDPDPACPHCQGTGRAGAPVLRRGSWRHTRSHEFILMLCKSMSYWANGEAVKEASKNTPALTWEERKARGEGPRRGYSANGIGSVGGGPTRNPRSVLTPAPSSLSMPHYAAFPPSLIEPLIKATCPAQCCAVCGAGYAPIVASRRLLDGHIPVTGAFAMPDEPRRAPANGIGHARYSTQTTVGALQPSCACGADLQPVPGVCLDPFAGASTTLLVARALGRQALGVEASATYVQLSRERLGLTALDAWEHGAPAVPVTYTDLPLFAQEE